MSSRFSRFLHLERSRGERPKPEEPSRLQSSGRFEEMAQRAEGLDSTVVPEAHVERFKRHGETPLVLAEKPAEGQLFPRCARCGSDNGRYAQQCTGCGADLTTPEQRAYTEQHWQERQARESEAQRALAEDRQRREALRKEEEARRVETIARLYLKKGGGSWVRYVLSQPSIGLGLLGLIPHVAARWAVLGGAILVPLVLLRFGSRPARFAGLMMMVAVALLLIPRSWLSYKGGRWRGL
jgi:hypothetical protein